MPARTTPSLPSVSLPTTPGIHVLRWPPGMGKSFEARRAIDAAFNRGELSRVVWAVQSTVSELALAKEARDHFNALKEGRFSIVEGRTDASGRARMTAAEYQKQFVWSDDPEIKIISFAHLHLAFDHHALLNQLKPDLLVIDESPHNALIETHEQTLHGLSRHSPLSAKLSDMLVAPQASFSSYVDLRKLSSRQHLAGTEFLHAVGNDWTADDWDELSLQVRTQSPYLTDEWIQAFRDDLAHPDGDSRRFGLAWEVDASGRLSKQRLYGNVLRSLHGLPPTLVLDAYADQSIYDAVFTGYTVHPIKRVDDGPNLVIHQALPLHLDDLNLKKATQYQRHLHVAEEILTRHQAHPLTVVATKSQLEDDTFVRAMEDASARMDLTSRPTFLHHHAGRGLNLFEGNDLYFLSKPHLPIAHQHQTMAALFRSDPAARARAHLWLVDPEQLQLAHRARQATKDGKARPKGERRPQIVFAYKVSPSLEARNCRVKAYRPHLKFTHKSRHPRWRDAVHCLADEMHQYLGGVFRSLYVVLDLVPGEMGAAGRVHHSQILKQALRLNPPPEATELGHWLCHGTLRRYQDVGCYSANPGMVKRVKKEITVERKKMSLDTELSEAGYVGLVKRQSRKVAGRILSTRVWVKHGTDQKRVFKTVYS